MCCDCRVPTQDITTQERNVFCSSHVMRMCDCAGEGDVKYVRYYQFYVMLYCSIYSNAAPAPRCG